MAIKIKKWVLTPHAAERVFERKLSVQELNSLITYPEEIISQGRKLILTKTFRNRRDNKVAAVVVEKQGDDVWLVITVMVNFRIRN